jgi:hypothetical protein
VSNPGDWVTVASCYFLGEADLIRSVLEGHEIPVYLKGEHTAGLAPHLSFLDRGLRIQVPREDAGRARAVLERQVWTQEEGDEVEEAEGDGPGPDGEPFEAAGAGRARAIFSRFAWLVMIAGALVWVLFVLLAQGW